MAEKNTLSILETIKKKMNSFDQKNTKDVPVSDVRKELDYNSPPKNKIEEKPIEEVKKIATENDKVDDINFDDFDLDDENKIIQNSSENPLPKTVKTQEVEENDDIEDYEDEDEFAEDLDDLLLEEEIVEEEIHEETKSKIQEPETHEEPHEEVKEEIKKDDFNFTDALPIENESKKIEEVENKKAEEIVSSNQSLPNFEPLEPLPSFEGTEIEIEQKKTEETQVVIPTEDKKDEILAEEKPEILELKSDENESLEIQKTEELKVVNQKTVEEIVKAVEAKSEASEIEDEIFKLPPAAETKADVKVEELDDFDELHKDLASDDHHEISVEKNILSDDLKFEESHLENISAEPEKVEAVQIEAEDDSLSLGDLDSVNLVENSSQKKSEEKLSTQDEIDLEFEKEIMGLKPEVPDENKKQKIAEKIFEQPIVQQTKPSSQEIIKQNFSVVTSIQNSSPQNNPQNNGRINDVTIIKTTDSIKKLIDAKNVVNGISTFSQSPAFAEIAVQLMEPKLEKWLNDNLPELVENIVREEIKKIIPK